MTPLEQSVWRLLDAVHDPCSVRMGKPLGLASMGLVEAVTIDEVTIHIDLVLTGPGCFFYFQFADEIERALEPIAEGRVIDVAIDGSVMWTADRMHSPAVRTISIRKSMEN